MAAEHADIWNYPGDDVQDAVSRGALLDRLCAKVGRDPDSSTRSIVLPVDYDQPQMTRSSIARAVDAGFGHLVLSLPAFYPDGVARWVAAELIDASA